MSLLYFLENIRTPFADFIFSAITNLGSEIVFIAMAIIIFWCVDKKHGYFLMVVGFLGTIINQFMKIIFRIPRPWIIDNKFSIVESARADATGYSFPSGHSQNVVASFGSTAVWYKKRWLQIALVVLTFLVAFSRMYLGVHTPLDVFTALIIGWILVLGLYPLFSHNFHKTMTILLPIMLLAGISFVSYMEISTFPADVDPANLEDAFKNSYTLMGAVAGLCIVYPIESKYIKFETKAVWWAQVLKVVCGLIFVLLVKEGLKMPLNYIFNNHPCAHAVRYFLTILAAGIIWPLTFKKFSKLGIKP